MYFELVEEQEEGIKGGIQCSGRLVGSWPGVRLEVQATFHCERLLENCMSLEGRGKKLHFKKIHEQIHVSLLSELQLKLINKKYASLDLAWLQIPATHLYNLMLERMGRLLADFV